jgi:transcriptional regulator with GAF, ATPase, and Fis domain
MTVDPEALTASLRRLASRAGESGVIETLHELTEACVDLFGVSGSGIMIADEQNVTRYVAASDGHGKFLEQAESQTGQGVCTAAFVDNIVVHSTDLAEDSRWPELTAAVAGRGIHAVLGVPVRLGAIPVGTLDVFRDHPHEWGDSESRALVRYSGVIETTLTAALQAHTAGELAGQLQYALDYRVIIERAVGYLMAAEQIDAVTAFNRLRRVARSNRVKLGQVAEQLLNTGRLAATS